MKKIQILYNPFIYVAGLKSLAFAIAIVLFTAWVCYVTGTHNYGLVNINFASDTLLRYFLLEHLAHWLASALILFVFGIMFSKSSIRIVDVLGTTGISRAPLLVLPLTRLLPMFRSFTTNSPNLYVLSVLHVLMVVWVVALTFHAYRISCNVKPPALAFSFIVALVLAEIVSRLSLYFFTTL